MELRLFWGRKIVGSIPTALTFKFTIKDKVNNWGYSLIGKIFVLHTNDMGSIPITSIKKKIRVYIINFNFG